MTPSAFFASVQADAGRGLADADFERLRQFFYQRTGIQFAPTKRYFVDKRVLGCMREFGTEDFGQYLWALRLGVEPGLFQRLVNALTVNETYFLREDYQFETLVRSVLPAIVAARGSNATAQPIRILSLPCSTGDEPYSIAITLLESWRGIDDHEVEIVAADIDTRALESAERGEYGTRALQRLPKSMLERYFRQEGEGRWRIDPALTAAIKFTQANLTEVASMSRLRNFDAVFCRNLLIYFDESSSRAAAENLYDSIRPGGYLFLGHAESMSRITNIFTPRRLDEGIVYQKPL